jgi:hypothetical protein
MKIPAGRVKRTQTSTEDSGGLSEVENVNTSVQKWVGGGKGRWKVDVDVDCRWEEEGGGLGT